MSIVPIHKAVYRIPAVFGDGGTVFIYLVKGDSIALIDTGAAGCPQQFLEPALAEIGLALSDVDLILNTHGHLDHTGGNRVVKEASGARILVHAADADIAQSADAQVEFMTGPLRYLGFSEESLKARGEYVRKVLGAPAAVDTLVSDGDIIDLGGGIKLRAMHTPGHTPGTTCYFWESEGVFFVADAIQGYGWRPGIFPLYFDAPGFRRSLALLDQVDFQLLCTAHAFTGGGPINDPTRSGPEGKALIQESIRVADTIDRVVAELVKSMPDAGKGEIALAAVSELIYTIPMILVRETRMPGVAGPTLATHIKAALEGSYPRS